MAIAWNLTNTQSKVIPHNQDISTINGLESRLQEIETAGGTAADDIEALEWRMDTAEAGIADRYTKSETDAAISSAVASVYKYKGSVANYAALPATGQIVGDVYNVEAADASHDIKAGDNVAWNGTGWDVLAGTVDLSSYFHKTDDDADDILEGSSHLFMTTAERSKLGDQSGVNTGDETQATIKTKLGAASASADWYLTKEDFATFNGKQDAIADLANIRSRAEGSIQATDATFASNTVAEGNDGKVTVTAADNKTVAQAESNNKAAIAALGTAHNNLVDRIETLEEGDDEKTKFFQVTFSGTSHSYSNAFIKADSFVNYNFGAEPNGYVSFSVEAGKVTISSSATESNLVIKLEVTNNPGEFTVLNAD